MIMSERKLKMKKTTVIVTFTLLLCVMLAVPTFAADDQLSVYRDDYIEVTNVKRTETLKEKIDDHGKRTDYYYETKIVCESTARVTVPQDGTVEFMYRYDEYESDGFKNGFEDLYHWMHYGAEAWGVKVHIEEDDSGELFKKLKKGSYYDLEYSNNHRNEYTYIFIKNELRNNGRSGNYYVYKYYIYLESSAVASTEYESEDNKEEREFAQHGYEYYVSEDKFPEFEGLKDLSGKVVLEANRYYALQPDARYIFATDSENDRIDVLDWSLNKIKTIKMDETFGSPTIEYCEGLDAYLYHSPYDRFLSETTCRLYDVNLNELIRAEVIIPLKENYVGISKEYENYSVGSSVYKYENGQLSETKLPGLFLVNYTDSKQMIGDYLMVCSARDVRGVCDYSGNIIVPIEYSSIKDYKDGLFIVTKGKVDQYKYGLVRDNGQIVAPTEYDEIKFDKDGNVKLGVWNGKWDYYPFMIDGNKISYKVYDYTTHTVDELISNSKYAIPEVQVFSDVPVHSYYHNAVKWANEKGITNGIGNGLFGSGDILTRGQAVTFLWRAMGKPQASEANNSFIDVKEGAYYYDAVAWAVENGITEGVGGQRFDPDGKVTRGQIITFLWRTNGEPNDTGGAWYEAAEEWAKSSNILEGTAQAYSTNASCPRSDVVYYMYNNMAESE